MEQDWTRVAGTGDVGDGEAFPVEIAGWKLALFRVGQEWFCTENVCTHAFALLTEGWFEGHVIECPLHGGQFDIRTGKGLCAPVTKDLKVFPVRVERQDVLVALP